MTDERTILSHPAEDTTGVIEVMLLRWGDGPNGPWIRLQLDDADQLEAFRALKAGPTHGQRMAVSFALIDDDESTEPMGALQDGTEGNAGEVGIARQTPPGARVETGEPNLSVEQAAGRKAGRSRPVPDEMQQLVDDPVRQSVDCWRLCGADDFRRYLKAEYEDVWRKTMRDADMSINKFAGAVVSNLCGTHTRAAFDYHGEPRRLWMSLRTMYGYWRAAQGMDKDRAEQRMGEAGG